MSDENQESEIATLKTRIQVLESEKITLLADLKNWQTQSANFEEKFLKAEAVVNALDQICDMLAEKLKDA